MAEALMGKRIAELSVPAAVASAGLLEGGRTSPPEVVELMASIGADLAERRSRQVSIDDVDHADLVLTMERRHLREVAIMTPTAWQKTFTLKELVRRGASVGGALEDEPLDSWIARAHAGREPADLLGEAPIDEVADPYGAGRDAYAATNLELEGLVTQLADLIFLPASVQAEPSTGELMPAEPTPAEPTPAEPTPAEPTPAEPTPAEPRGRSRFGLVRRG
jgi:protein-tyrosine-phosphatase